jgi:hypothetical protein
MLKKISHIILFIVLLTATTGMAVSKHFCNGYLISSSIYTEADSCCDDECCRNNQEFIQLDVDFNVSEFSAIPDVCELGLMFAGPGQFDLLLKNEYIHIFQPENEPPPPGVKTWLALRQTYLL